MLSITFSNLYMESQTTEKAAGPSSDFKFKYVAEEELLRIVRKVRREKQKEQDELVWRRFVEKRDKTDTQEPPSNSIACEHEDTRIVELSVDPSCHHNDKHNYSSRLEMFKDAAVPSVHLEKNIVLDEQIKTSLPSKHTDSYLSTRDSRSLQRVAVLRYRIGLALDSVQAMLQCQPAEPDGPDDYERRRTRANEFLSRFSRNYLFQLRMKVAELRRQIVCSSLETPGRHTEHQALLQKFVSAHQTAVQSLQAYLTQLPASQHSSNIFGKLQDLLRHLCDLCLLKNQLESHAVILDGLVCTQETDEIYEKCKELMIVLEEKRAEVEEVSLSARASSPLSTRGSASLRLQHHSKAVRSQGAGAGTGAWKRPASHLARLRFGAPSSLRSSASPRQSNGDKSQRIDPEECSAGDLKDILLHIHDIVCKKGGMSDKKKRNGKDHSKPDRKGPKLRRKSSACIKKPLMEVQNLSSNVQLVITRHPDTDSEECRDVGTDTVDLNCNDHPGKSKKIKKVEWAESSTATVENTVLSLEADVKEKSAEDACNISSKESPYHRTLSERRVHSYRDRFLAYKTQLQNPTLQRWCEDILDSVFQEIAKELEPSFLLEKMYQLEFKD